jgi:hypothetical protein
VIIFVQWHEDIEHPLVNQFIIVTIAVGCEHPSGFATGLACHWPEHIQHTCCQAVPVTDNFLHYGENPQFYEMQQTKGYL